MIGVESCWELLKKSHELLASSRQLLKQLNGRTKGNAAPLDLEKTDLGSKSPPKRSQRQPDSK
jgi:hypothetical protein